MTSSSRRPSIAWGRRTTIRGIPGFTWIQVCLHPHRRPQRPRRGWLYRPLVRRYDLGPVIFLTMRSDALQRAGVDPSAPAGSPARAGAPASAASA